MAGNYGFNPYEEGQYNSGSSWLSQYAPPQQAKINPLAFAAQAGGGLLGEIAGYLGDGQKRRDQKWGRGQLKGMMGKPVFRPGQITGKKKLSYMSNLRGIAGGANRRLGLDSGRAWEEMMSKYGNMEGDELAQLMVQEAFERSRRDTGIAGMFYGGGG